MVQKKVAAVRVNLERRVAHRGHALCPLPEDLALGIFDRERLDSLLADLDALQAGESSHPVIQVDHVVPGRERGDGLERGDPVQPLVSSNAP